MLAANARDEYKPTIEDAEQWLSRPANFALVDGDDLSMFEAQGAWPGPLVGHIFFASRGKQALATARKMLARAFAFGATEILGETPAEYRDALLFIRLLGFRPYAKIEAEYGPAILSRLNANPQAGDPVA